MLGHTLLTYLKLNMIDFVWFLALHHRCIVGFGACVIFINTWETEDLKFRTWPISVLECTCNFQMKSKRDAQVHIILLMNA